MAGLVPAIFYVFTEKEDVDARHKAGHDGESRERDNKSLQYVARPPEMSNTAPVV